MSAAVTLFLLCAAPSALDEARARTVTELEQLCAWAADQRLPASVFRTYGWIIRFDPEHRRARSRLGYRQAKDGRWYRPSVPKPRSDLSVTGTVRFDERARKIADRLGRALIAAMEEGAIGGATAYACAKDVWAIDPNHFATREQFRCVQFEGRWEAEEVAGSRARAARLRAAAKRLRAIPVVGETRDMEEVRAAWGKTIDGELVRGDVRALSIGCAPELPELLRRVHAVPGLLAVLFDAPPPRVPGLTLVVAQDAAAMLTWLRAREGVDAATLRLAAQESVVWIPSTEIVVLHAAARETRTELAVHAVTQRLLYGAFGVDERTGWAHEGVAHHVSKQLLRRRTESFAGRQRYRMRLVAPRDETDLYARMIERDANWFAMASYWLSQGKSPDLALMLHKDIRGMRARDMLFAYALVAYLSEAKEAQLAAFLRGIGAGKAPGQALQHACGLDLAALRQRLELWLPARAALGEK
ncbi:MAG: hypothetical protein AAGD14_19885 [Planctomycetota bacterium]